MKWLLILALTIAALDAMEGHKTPFFALSSDSEDSLTKPLLAAQPDEQQDDPLNEIWHEKISPLSNSLPMQDGNTIAGILPNSAIKKINTDIETDNLDGQHWPKRKCIKQGLRIVRKTATRCTHFDIYTDGPITAYSIWAKQFLVALTVQNRLEIWHTRRIVHKGTVHACEKVHTQYLPAIPTSLLFNENNSTLTAFGLTAQKLLILKIDTPPKSDTPDPMLDPQMH